MIEPERNFVAIGTLLPRASPNDSSHKLGDCRVSSKTSNNTRFNSRCSGHRKNQSKKKVLYWFWEFFSKTHDDDLEASILLLAFEKRDCF
jgi:hypothetical protein